MPTRLRFSALAERGLVRTNLDNATLVFDLATGASPDPTHAVIESPAGFVLAVLGTSGGFRWGEPGDALVAASLRASLTGATSPAALVEAMHAASRALDAEVLRDRRREGLNAVATVGLVRDHTLSLVHLGDACVFLLRDGRLAKLTREHTMLNDAAELGFDPAHCFPGVLSRALGYKTTVDVVSVATTELRAGDTLLFCTQGLHTQVDHSAIERALVEHAEPAAAGEALRQLVLRAGARYNAAILVVRFAGAG